MFHPIVFKPSTKIFFAALISRSCSVPQYLHTQCSRKSFTAGSRVLQTEQMCEACAFAAPEVEVVGLGFYSFDDFCGYTTHDCIGGHIFTHHGTRSNDGSIPDGHSLQNGGM